MSIAKKWILRLMPIIVVYVCFMYIAVGVKDLKLYSLNVQYCFQAICDSFGDIDLYSDFQNIIKGFNSYISDYQTTFLDVKDAISNEISWWEKAFEILKCVFTFSFLNVKLVLFGVAQPILYIIKFVVRLFTCAYTLLKCLFDVNKGVLLKHQYWYDNINNNLVPYQKFIDSISNYVNNLKI